MARDKIDNERSFSFTVKSFKHPQSSSQATLCHLKCSCQSGTAKTSLMAGSLHSKQCPWAASELPSCPQGFPLMPAWGLKFVEWIHGRLLTTEAFIAPMEDLSNWLALEDIVPDTHGQSHIGLRELFSMCDSEVGSKFLPKGISRHRPMGLLHIHLEGAQLVEPLQLRQVKISKLYHTLPLTHILDSSARGTAWLKVSLCVST